MSAVTQILSAIEQGDPVAAEKLLPLVYDELRKLAAAKLAHESSGQTLQATALVHEAYLRLVDGNKIDHWNSRAHFFGAAAEAMRRILVEQARRKNCLKRGGDEVHQPLHEAEIVAPQLQEQILVLHEALDELSRLDAQAAELVKLRYFVGLTSSEASEILGLSARTADRLWVYAKAFLLRACEQD